MPDQAETVGIFNCVIKPMADWYCAYTPELDVCGYGETQEAAKEQMCQAARMAATYIVKHEGHLDAPDQVRLEHAKRLLAFSGSLSLLFNEERWPRSS